MAIVSANRSFDIYLSSTAPNQLRFRVINAPSTFKIRLSMHFFTSNRIDVYKNDTFINPTNAQYQNGKMILKDTTANLDAYMPHYSNSSGTNLAVRSLSKVYFTIAGGDYIDLKITPMIFVKFGVPAITQDAFFDETTVVSNFAALLGIDPWKIRKVEIIRETGKKRRATGATSFISLTIFEDPISSLKNENAFDSINTTIKNLTATIVNRFTTGDLQASAKKVFNVEIQGLSIKKSDSNGTDAEINQMSKIKIVQEADGCREQSPCTQQPILIVLDKNVFILFSIKILNPLLNLKYSLKYN